MIRRLAPVLALAVVASLLVYLANSAQGQTLQRLELHNTGIWASSSEDAMVGRFAKAASALEFGLVGNDGSAANVDVYQDGNVAVAHYVGEGLLYPVDALQAKILKDRYLALPEGAIVDMRGGTIAVLDPRSGAIWAVRTLDAAEGVDLSPLDVGSPQVASLGVGEAAALAVGVDGAVHAVNSNGKAVRIPVVDGVLGAPVESTVQRMSAPQVTAVGAEAVLLDGAAGTLYVGSSEVAVGEGAVLQQPSDAAETVFVATPAKLLKVGFDGKLVTAAILSQDTAAAAPAVVAGCAFGAWSSGDVARYCGEPVTRKLEEGLEDPVFRVNWGALVLNDRATGVIYDWDLDVSLDEWSLVKEQEPEEKKNTTKKAEVRQDAPPKAVNDAWGVRKGRSGVLHVLDNDSDPNGSMLSIVSVTQPKNGGRVTISPDGQSVLYAMPADGVNDSFKYTIRNDVGEATATVQVEARHPDQHVQNVAPRLREFHSDAPTYAVGSQGLLPIAVATDYRDYDSDPVTVFSAQDDLGNIVAITSDGQIEYAAAVEEKTRDAKVDFQVTDGLEKVDDFVRVKVIGSEDKTGAAPQAQADVARGVVGEPITIKPLANDIPGVDPSNPQARLKLAADVDPRSRLTVHTDRASGIVTVTAAKAGRYKLSYSVAFGTAPRGKDGQIRVEVAKKLDDDLPVAMPDEVTIHSTTPANFDPLRNDFDPGGGMLSVVSAVAEDPSVLTVAVWDKRWIRVEARDPEISGAQAITYQITNGDGRLVDGTAVVTQLSPVKDDEPLLRDDWVTARAGDSVLIPVLENDTSTGGSTLSLLTNSVDGSPGQFAVTETSANAFEEEGADLGRAYAVGNQIRYVAPAPEEVDTDRQFRISYYARTPSGEAAEGTVYVTVKPALADTEGNSAPQPQTIEARVVSGEQVTIKVPSTQQDPDGDSVMLVKIASAPSKGRVLEFSPDGIVYEAFPDVEFTGTDSFEYVLADQYGKEGTGTIRVNVISPGQTQPPLAVDDALTAEPGVSVNIDVMDNDYISSDDAVEISLLDGNPEGVELVAGRFVKLTVPAEGEPAATAMYSIRGNGDGETVATVSVTGKEGFKNPPRVDDKVAVAGEKDRASVDLLEDAYDPDSDVTKTVITIPHATEEQAVVIAEGVVELNMLPVAQIVTFVATDESGAATSGIIYVPAKDDGFPYATGLIEIPANSTLSFDVADYVKSSRPNRTAVITVSDLVRATPRHLSVEVGDSLDRFTLTSADDYTGPGAVTMQVTDGFDVTDPDGKIATVSIPVQVGPVTPVLRCPEAQQTIRQGAEKKLDVRTLCHVWPADATAAFEYEWSQPISNVSFADSDQATLRLTANGAAKPGDEGSITVRVAGESAEGKINLVVKAASPPSISPITLEVKQGETATDAIHLSSPLRQGREDTIVSCTPADDETKKSGIRCKGAGSKTWSVTPGSDFSGQLVYKLTVSDISDTDQVGRQATTTLTVNVYGRPGVPEGLHQADGVQSNAITMAWKAAAENGAPIDEYELETRGGGTIKCPTLTCTVKPLKNGDYKFRVRAHNRAGWGDWSDAVDGTADAFPDAPAGCVASNPLDKEITLSWLPVSGDYSPVKWYYVRHSGQEDPFRTAGDHVLHNLENLQTTFEIWSENDFGRSLTSCTVVGWPSGPPQDVTLNKPKTHEDGNPYAEVTWPAAKANGETPVEYTLFHNGNEVSGCVNITERSCHVSATLDGAKHTFKLAATNKPHKEWGYSDEETWYAEGTPPQPAAPTVKATGDNDMARVSGQTSASRGLASKSYVKIYNGDSVLGTATLSDWKYDKTLDVGTNGKTSNIGVKLCYTSSEDGEEVCGKLSATKSVVPFGPMIGPTVISKDSLGHMGEIRVTADGNGAEATLSVQIINPDNANCTEVTVTGKTQMTVTARCGLGGPDMTRSVKIVLKSSATDPARPTIQKSDTVTSQPALSARFGELHGTYNAEDDTATASLWEATATSGLKVTVRLSAPGCGYKEVKFTSGGRLTTLNGGPLTLTCDMNGASSKTFTAQFLNPSTEDADIDGKITVKVET
ncbi:MAG: hypothetical protein LBR58_11620 [Propionibacteriaceae bacterium]|jgi:hypothetical protein|nr:hypothetical protein [Propionibacteriaceae bacterium]